MKHGTYRSPLNTSYAWDISHALTTLYHPYTHEPLALTEYLKRKLQVQRAKRRSHSHPAQVEQNVPLEHNTLAENAQQHEAFLAELDHKHKAYLDKKAQQHEGFLTLQAQQYKKTRSIGHL